MPFTYFDRNDDNRYRRIFTKVDASIFDSALARVGKKEKKIACPHLDVFACGQISSPRLYNIYHDIFEDV